MRAFRRLIFAIFTIAYLIICPLAILYAFGYSLRPGAGQGLVRTGLIYLSTDPPGASVYFGKRRYTQRTPAMLHGLLPGQYPVRIVLKGYRSWERVLPVEAEKATALDHILLLPLQWRPDVKLAAAFTELIPMPGSRFLLLSTGPRLSDLEVYDWKDGKAWPLVAGHHPLASAKVLARFLVKDSAWCLLRVELSGGERWLWCELRRGETAIEDLTNAIFEPPEAVAWDPHNRRYLFALNRGGVDRLDPVEKATSPKWLEQVRGFGLAGRTLYVLEPDGLVLKMDREGKEVEPVAELPMARAPLLGRPSLFQIRAVTPTSLLLLGERGELLMGRPPSVLAESGVIGVDWHPRRQRVLVWTRQRIGVMSLPEDTLEGDRAAPLPQLRWLFQQGQHIEQAGWLEDGSHILFLDAGSLYLLELDIYGAPRVEPLVDTLGGPFLYAEELGAVYYLERTTGHLMSLPLLPKHEILPLPVLGDEHEPPAARAPRLP